MIIPAPSVAVLIVAPASAVILWPAGGRPEAPESRWATPAPSP